MLSKWLPVALNLMCTAIIFRYYWYPGLRDIVSKWRTRNQVAPVLEA